MKKGIVICCPGRLAALPLAYFVPRRISTSTQIFYSRPAIATNCVPSRTKTVRGYQSCVHLKHNYAAVRRETDVGYLSQLDQVQRRYRVSGYAFWRKGQARRQLARVTFMTRCFT